MNTNEKGTQAPKICLGIDLGTTTSSMAYSLMGDIKMIENAEGKRTTPSYVYIDKDKSLSEIGEVARRRASKEPQNVFMLFKRLIGKKYNELGKQELDSLNYKVVSGDKGMAFVEDSYGYRHSPIFLSSRVLKYLKEEAEKKLGTKIEHAVITVPAYFNNDQREATKQAGKLAGLEVERIVSEPTAAILATSDTKSKEKILIYDLGGGTFDVSLADKDGSVIQIIGQDGDTQLGGADFDNSLVDLLVRRIKSESGIDPRGHSRAMYELKTAAENAKKELDLKPESEINIPYLGAEFGNDEFGNPRGLEMKIMRSHLKEATQHLIDKSIAILDKTISESGLEVDDIDKVILVGGMTRSLMVQEAIKDKFGESKVVMKHNPDEVVAMGAAVQGRMIMGEDSTDITLLDATPLSMGIETHGGRMTVIIPKNTSIPCSEKQEFSTATDNQTSVTVSIFQGERAMAADNHPLGSFDLLGIDPAPRGVPQIEVCFDLSADGILNVTAKDKKTNKTKDIKIDSNISDEEIKKMQDESIKYKAEDEKRSKFLDTKMAADSMCYMSEKLLKDSLKDEQVHKDLKASIDGLRSLLEQVKIDEVDELNLKIKELEERSKAYREALQAKGQSGNDETKSESEEQDSSSQEKE